MHKNIYTASVTMMCCVFAFIASAGCAQRLQDALSEGHTNPQTGIQSCAAGNASIDSLSTESAPDGRPLLVAYVCVSKEVTALSHDAFIVTTWTVSWTAPVIGSMQSNDIIDQTSTYFCASQPGMQTGSLDGVDRGF